MKGPNTKPFEEEEEEEDKGRIVMKRVFRSP